MRRRATALSLIASLVMAGGSDPAAGATVPQATTITLAGDSFGDGLDGLRATLASPWGVAAGPDGVYISDNGHHQLRALGPDGVITRVAGISEGFGGDGGQAAQAKLNRPRGMALDDSGGLLLADSGNSRIRRVDLASGVITTIAGNGNRTYGGDGGPATLASLAFPYDVTTDPFGNIIIADFENSRIRRVNRSGVIETIAGTGNRSDPADLSVNDFDGVPASTAQIKPTAVVTDAEGNIFFGDNFGCRVRRIDRASRIVTTLAGEGCSYAGDGGPAAGARFRTVWDLVFDPQGRLVVADADNNRIRRFETDGTVGTIVGDGASGCPAGEGPATGPSGTWPIALAYDAEGTLHYAANGCGRTYAASGGTIRHASGRGSAFAGDPGDPATSINFALVEAVAWGPDGLPYFSDQRGIWRIEEDGAATLVAGGQAGDADGPALEAKFGRIRGLGFDASDALWIADLGAGKVKRLADGMVQTMAGNPSASAASLGTDGQALGIRLTGVIDVVPAPDGSVYFNEATEVTGRVRRLADGQVTLVAGPRDNVNRYLDPIGDGGPATGALFRYLRGLALAPDGTILVVDSSHQRIRRVVPGGAVTTVAGDGGEISRGDGTIAELASFSSPEDVVAGPAGDLFITDGKNEYTGQPAQYTIRHVAPNGMVTRIAGTGATGQGGNGPALETPLSNPQALAVGPKGLLVADTTGVRLIRPPGGGWPRPARVVRCDSAFADPDGDAFPEWFSTRSPTNVPWLDLVDATVETSATHITVTMRFLDLTERILAPPVLELGTAWAWTLFFKEQGGDTGYRYMTALAPYPLSSPGGIAFEYGRSGLGRGSSSKDLTSLGAATGSIDMTKDTVTVSAPLAALDLAAGDVLLYREVTSGELVEVGFSRFINPDDTTNVSGFLPGTARAQVVGRGCPEGY